MSLPHQLSCPDWPNPEPPDKLPIIARNAIALYDAVVKSNVQERIIHEGDIKTWHERLFRGAVPVPYYAGHYRSNDSRFPCLQVDVEVNGIYGSPFAYVPAHMQAFSSEMGEFILETDRFLKSKSSKIQKAAAAVQLATFLMGRLIQIHPFLNGNGRTARVLANWCFNRYGYHMPFFLDRPAAVDYAIASASAMRGDMTPLYRYLLTILAQ